MKSRFVVISSLCFWVSLTAQSEVTFRYKTAYDKPGRLLTPDTLDRNSVNPRNQVVFVLSGLDKADEKAAERLADAYAEKQVNNVFLVEWGYDSEADEKKSIADAEEAGVKLANFIETLINKTEEKYLDIHLVGIFLGSRASHIAAKQISMKLERKVNRITELDPTRLIKEEMDSQSPVLYEEYVNLVDAVHSNLSRFRGELKRFGHVDFYVDDGICSGARDETCGKLDGVGMFTKSVNSSELRATKCSSVADFRSGKCERNDTVVFGENMPQNAAGAYFIKFESE